MKEFLEKEGVNLNRFKTYRTTSKTVIRRSLKRMFGGETTIPVPCTNSELREKIKAKLDSGEIKLGNMICPREYKKLIITPEGTIEEQTFQVSGRQICLRNLRQQILKEHEEMGLVRDHSDERYMNMTANEIVERLMKLGEYHDSEDLTLQQLKERLQSYERRRHLITWSDHSSIMNHGHFS